MTSLQPCWPVPIHSWPISIPRITDQCIMETSPPDHPPESSSQPPSTSTITPSAFEALLSTFLPRFSRVPRTTPFTLAEISHIATLLSIVSPSRPSWAARPRVYIVLRLIGCLDLMQAFVVEGKAMRGCRIGSRVCRRIWRLMRVSLGCFWRGRGWHWRVLSGGKRRRKRRERAVSCFLYGFPSKSGTRSRSYSMSIYLLCMNRTF